MEHIFKTNQNSFGTDWRQPEESRNSYRNHQAFEEPQWDGEKEVEKIIGPSDPIDPAYSCRFLYLVGVPLCYPRTSDQLCHSHQDLPAVVGFVTLMAGQVQSASVAAGLNGKTWRSRESSSVSPVHRWLVLRVADVDRPQRPDDDWRYCRTVHSLADRE
jgi:hypothetical protein